MADRRLIAAIWGSFRALPGWVQVWVAFILVPVNSAAILFVGQPGGVMIAFLAIIAMLPNIWVMVAERGLSNAMALPHLIPWTLLVVILIWFRPEATGAFAIYLWVLLAVDVISLAFDYPDAWRWWKGDREVAR